LFRHLSSCFPNRLTERYWAASRYYKPTTDDMLKTTLLGLLFFAVLAAPPALAAPPQFDVVVYGATPSGIAAAINAAESDSTVALIEESDRIGGLVTGGLSYTDFRSLESLGGTFRDYMRRVERYYIAKYGADSEQAKDCFFGAHAEPHVSLAVFRQMLAEQPRVKLFLRHRLAGVVSGEPVEGLKTVRAVRLLDLAQRQTVELAGRVFIDSTYEGDLAAMVGAPFRVGRESTREYGERLAGVIYFHDGRILPGSTGEGDERVQDYNFRIIMTRRLENRVMITKPADYRREDYVHHLKHFTSGRIKHIFTESADGVLRVQKIPNDKADINDIKQSPIRLSLPGENYDYPNGGPEVRAAIVEHHRRHNLGLIYFLQNDPEIPAGIRAEACEWGLAKDEFAETGHFPPRLYIREARRIVGEYVFTERDALMSTGSVRAPLHKDSIAIGDYTLNCHGEQPPGPLHPNLTEGDFTYETVPFQIPYGVLVPQKVGNLLVSVAVSATHVGFSGLRLEPTWTALGQAAGIAAHLALRQQVPMKRVAVEEVQRLLHQRGAMTVYFADVSAASPEFKAAQHFGTLGFFHQLVDPKEVVYRRPARRHGLQYFAAFPHHEAELDKPMDEQLARRWIGLLPDADARARAGSDVMLRAASKLTRGAFLRRLAE
jgi:hypothetical protein